MHKTALFFTICICVLFGLLVKPVRAASDIANSTYVFYQIDENSDVKVTYDIELVNVTGTQILSSYILKLPYTDSRSLQVFENDNPAIYTVNSGDNFIQLNIKLAKEVFGKNASVKIKVTFFTSDLKSKNDSLNFNFPSIKFTEDVRQLNAKITAPSSLGKVNFISAGIEKLEIGDEGYSIVLTKTDLEKNTRIEFNDKRNYYFTYRYPIKNGDKKFNTYSVTLPPIISRQNTYYNLNNTIPDNTIKDRDGNLIAQYYLEPGETKEIVISGVISLSNDYHHTADNKYLNELLDNGTYLSKDLELVKQIAKEIEEMDGTIEDKGEAINSKVVNLLSFDKTLFSNNGYSRRKSDALLNNPTQSLSIDYADIFVSIARTAKIPSRIVVGKLMNAGEFSLNGSNLHAWVEIYDQDKGWIPFDPALEDVTGYKYGKVLSLNHIALGIWGTHDSSPNIILPFNLSSANVDDYLDIYLYQNYIRNDPEEMKYSVVPIKPVISNIHDPFDVKFNIENMTDQPAYFTDFFVHGYRFDKSVSEGDHIPVIFPYSTQEVTVKVYPHSYLSVQGEDILNVEIKAIAEKEYKFNFSQAAETDFLPIYIASWGVTFFIVIFIVFFLFYRRHLKKQKYIKRSLSHTKHLN